MGLSAMNWAKRLANVMTTSKTRVTAAGPEQAAISAEIMAATSVEAAEISVEVEVEILVADLVEISRSVALFTTSLFVILSAAKNRRSGREEATA